MRSAERVIFVWVALLALRRVLLPGWLGLPLLGGYFNLFAVGCVLSLIRREALTGRLALAFGVVTALALESAFGRAALASQALPDVSPCAAVAVLAGAIAGFAIFVDPRLSGLRLPWAKSIGALTYPLYLLHDRIGLIVLGYTGSGWPMILAVTLAMILLSHAVSSIYEPIARPFWKTVFESTLGRALRSSLPAT